MSKHRAITPNNKFRIQPTIGVDYTEDNASNLASTDMKWFGTEWRSACTCYVHEYEVYLTARTVVQT